MRFNTELEHISTYQAGKPIEEVVRNFGLNPNDIIKLASNENPYSSSPRVIEALKANANKAHLYPDDSMIALKEGLAQRFSVEAQNIIIGSGSDQVIEMCVRTKENLQEDSHTHQDISPKSSTNLGAKSSVLMAGITFAMYEIYAKIAGFNIIRTQSQTHNLAEFKSLLEAHKPEIIFLCVPNNPLGECLEAKEVYAFLETARDISPQSLVLIDGAYQEFASFKDSSKRISPKDIAQIFPNAIYLGTFSKAYGLGGMRVGYGIANKNLISILHKVRPPFNITTLSLIAALEALKDSEFVTNCIKENFMQMQRYEDFAKSNGIEYIPSFTNFITFMLPSRLDSSKICDRLLRQGIIIRNLASYKMNACRITIGLDSQNTRVLHCLQNELNA